MRTITPTYSPEDVFEAFLFEQKNREKVEWQRYNGELHKAFYKAKEEFPQVMKEYEFLVRTQPTSQTLERMFWEFRQAGILTTEDGRTVIRNAEVLRKPDNDLRRVAVYICDLL